MRHPLSRVPENTLKFAVGVMLTSFGTFWAGEGVGIDWPGAEASLAALIVLTVAWSLLFTRLLAPAAAGGHGMKGLWHGIVEFVVGDDIWIAVSVLRLLGATAALVHARRRRLVAARGRRPGAALGLARARAPRGTARRKRDMTAQSTTRGSGRST